MSLFKRVQSFFHPQRLVRRSVETRYALIEACFIGLISALAALFLKEGINWLGSYRLQLANHWGAGITLPLAGLTLGCLAGWLIEQLSPAAAGGGIPQVKAVLGQYPIPLSLRVALVKMAGTILVLGAGLTLGRRGPTVHIGAALAAQLSNWLPTSPEHRRQMIAAGAAAGLAAGFNTPIAGVLFVVEELMRDISGLTLETAILASFTGAVVSRLLGSTALNIPEQILGTSSQSTFSLPELPFFLLLGILAGVLGGVFNRLILLSLSLNRRWGLGLAWRIGLAGLISGGIVAFLPPYFRNYAGLRDFLIGGEAGWETMAITFIAQFVLTLLAYGSGAPGGLFAPALVLGAALGYLVGIGEVLILGLGSASTYALAGMGAFFTAVVRVPVTAIVIVFELTTDFNVVLPLMIASVMSFIVAEKVSEGSLYEHLLAANGIKLQDTTPVNRLLEGLKAMDVMQPRVQTLSSQLTIDEARQAFSRSHYRGFPVVDQGKLVGIVTQADLSKVLSRSGESLLKEIMTPLPVTVKPESSLSDVLYLINQYQLSHLPVTEQGILRGIITRTDIIRAEADRLSGKRPQQGAKPEPSYLVYSTRAPALGKGRLLIPLANPHTAPSLLRMAAAIASQYQYELECVQVIQVPRHTSPAKSLVRTTQSRRLLREAERLGKRWEIPVHTQIRVAHDVAGAILEVISERHVNLTLMGWQGKTSTPGRIFGNVADTIIRQAPCDVMLVKLCVDSLSIPKTETPFSRWLIPIAGGPNAQRAIQLLPGLTAWSNSPEIILCHVYSSSDQESAMANIQASAQSLEEQLETKVKIISLFGDSVSEAVIKAVERKSIDVVVLGATREGLLQQVIGGNIPEAIAREVNSTVILVRGALD
ncbi:MAG: chloride channel protein [Cyanobacteriota bacterium]